MPLSNLEKKIHEVRSQSLVVTKTGAISGGVRAQYASYVDVWETLQPALVKAGLSVGFSGCNLTVRFEVPCEVVSMTLQVSDGEEKIESVFEMLVPEPIRSKEGGNATINGAQRVASGSAYCKRLALVHFFAISAGSNGDEVERMTPKAGQTNRRDMITIDDGAPWQDYTGGMWERIEAPGGSGMSLGEYAEDGGSLLGLWKDFPGHPGLMAYGHDWLDNKIVEGKWEWSDVVALEPMLPGSIFSCNATQLQAAVKAVAAYLKERK